jgi:hypothetical protein
VPIPVVARCADLFENRPSGRALGVLAPVAVLAAVAAQVGLQATMRRAEHPLTLAEANLVADAEEQRGRYRLLEEQGTFHWFVATELIDMLWALCLAAALVAVTVAVGRAHPQGSWWRRAALGSVPLAVVVPGLDLVENGVSLAMLADPHGFPAVLAPVHAGIATAKFAAMAVLLPYYAVHLCVLGVRAAVALVRPLRGAGGADPHGAAPTARER